MGFTTLSLVFFLVRGFPPVTGDVHSLLYLYTMQSKNSDSHLYDCTAVTLLNDRQIDFYNSSSDKPRTAKQNWLKNISDSDWETITEKLQYDRQLLNRLNDFQMYESGHSHSGVHVLQWRHGCEGEQSSDGSLTVLNSINEFGYDGEDLIQFNCDSNTWITPEEKKNREREEKWNKDLQHTAVKKCDQCEEILKMYLQYKTTEITQCHTPPAVHVFKKKSVGDSGKRILTCLAMGFYPKDVKMSLRKFGTSLPDHLITSSGVRPNDDGTYQLRKSVEIQEDDPADYDCYVTHSSLTEPVIKRWVNPKNSGGPGLIEKAIVGVVIGILLIPLPVLFFVLKKKRKIGGAGHQPDNNDVPQNLNAQGDTSSDGSSRSSEKRMNTKIPLLHTAPTGQEKGVNGSIELNGKGAKTRGSDSDSGRGSDVSGSSKKNIQNKSEGKYSSEEAESSDEEFPNNTQVERFDKRSRDTYEL